MTVSSRICIYEVFLRVFGNATAANVWAGDLAINGCGKFSSLHHDALRYIQQLGTTHIWLMGVIRHASLSSYPSLGIKADDPNIVKGKGGSPYAITDYYDVDPDLADNPAKRMDEFEQLVQRIHQCGMRVMLDFVPNHVSRSYCSTIRPDETLGRNDDKNYFFHPHNDFFYLVDPPGQRLTLTAPTGWDPGGLDGNFPLEDGTKGRVPRATGNNGTSVSPGVTDWYETIKLNYGYNFVNHSTHYDPVPPVWKKMDAILAYWQSKGVNGFRCDFAHWVPIEFWSYAIHRAKGRDATVFFAAEAYENHDGTPQPGSPPGGSLGSLLTHGQFDAVYDHASFQITRGIVANTCWANDFESQRPPAGLTHAYLRYAENHDERRAASTLVPGASPGDTGYGTPAAGLVAMAAQVLSSEGPILLYAGQEVGEPGDGSEGYNGDNGRTSLFDYWSPPALHDLHTAEYQVTKLAAEQRYLVSEYQKLMAWAQEPAMRAAGGYYGLNYVHSHDAAAGDLGRWVYTFLRYEKNVQVLLVAANFHSQLPIETQIRVPQSALLLAFGDGVSRVSSEPRRGQGGANVMDCSCWETDGLLLRVPANEYVILQLRGEA